MQCISDKFQLGQIAFLTENREGINATLELKQQVRFTNTGFSLTCYKHKISAQNNIKLKHF